MSSKDAKNSSALLPSKTKKKDKPKKESKKEKKEKSKKGGAKDLEDDAAKSDVSSVTTEGSQVDSSSPKAKKKLGIFKRLKGRKSKSDKKSSKDGSAESLKRQGDGSADFESHGSEFSLGESTASVEVSTTITEVPTTSVEVSTTSDEVSTTITEVPMTSVEVSTTIDEVSTTIAEVPTTSVEVSTTSDEVSTTITEVPMTNVEVSTTIDEVSTTIAEVPTTSVEVSTTSDEVSTTITEVPTTSVEVSTTIDEVSTTITEVPMTSVEVSTTSDEVSTTITEVPTTSVEVSTTSDEVSTTTTEVPTTSVKVSTTSDEVSTTTTEVPTTIAEVEESSEIAKPSSNTNTDGTVDDDSSVSLQKQTPVESEVPTFASKLQTSAISSKAKIDEEVKEEQHKGQEGNKNKNTKLVIEENVSTHEKKGQVLAPESERKYEVSLENIKKERDREVGSSKDDSVDTIISTEALSTRGVKEMTEEEKKGIGVRSKLDVEEPIIATYKEEKGPLQDALQELPPIDEDEIVLAYEAKLQEEVVRDEQPVQEEPIVRERREDVFQDEINILRTRMEEPSIATYQKGTGPWPLQAAVQELPPIDEDTSVLAYENRLQKEIIRDEQPVQEEPIHREKREDVFQNEIATQEELLTETESEPLIKNEKMNKKDKIHEEAHGEEPSAEQLLPPTHLQRKGDKPEKDLEDQAAQNELLPLLSKDREKQSVQKETISKERREDLFESEITVKEEPDRKAKRKTNGCCFQFFSCVRYY
ncbi:uncharacterized protein LOC144653837 isoform X2 [Oculina patagonica]